MAQTNVRRPSPRRSNPSVDETMEEFERVGARLQQTLDDLGVTPEIADAALEKARRKTLAELYPELLDERRR